MLPQDWVIAISSYCGNLGFGHMIQDVIRKVEKRPGITFWNLTEAMFKILDELNKKSKYFANIEQTEKPEPLPNIPLKMDDGAQPVFEKPLQIVDTVPTIVATQKIEESPQVTTSVIFDKRQPIIFDYFEQ